MKKKTPKQIAALLCVIFLVSLYLITFIIACVSDADSGQLFAACLAATIGLPILLWIILWFYGLMKERQKEAASSLPGRQTASETDKHK